MMNTVDNVTKWGPRALVLGWLLLGMACSGGVAEGVAMHPCRWEETCVVSGAEVSTQCDARWVCPAPRSGSAGPLAVSLPRARP